MGPASRTLDPILTWQVTSSYDATSSVHGKSCLSGSSSSSSSSVGNKRTLISSVCVLPSSPFANNTFTNNGIDKNDGKEDYVDEIETDSSCCRSSSSSEDNGDGNDVALLELRCSRLTRHEPATALDVTKQARESAVVLQSSSGPVAGTDDHSSSSSLLVATCHANGDAWVWDVSFRKVIQSFTNNSTNTNRGPGLTLRRCSDGPGNSHVLYHTRDTHGTVSLHDVQCARTRGDFRKGSGSVPTSAVVAQIETGSETFCAAAPCVGNGNLVALPSSEEGHVVVRDWRVPPKDAPILAMHAFLGMMPSSLASSPTSSSDRRVAGMLTSVALCNANATHGRPILACGMENGSVCFHDLAMLRKYQSDKIDNSASSPESCCISLSKDPVLALDMAPSVMSATKQSIDHGSHLTEQHIMRQGSVVAVAGLAGDAADLLDGVAEEDRGTVALLKTSITTAGMATRLRARHSTCAVHERSYGKPGVNVCRFRPDDGRVYCVGGWDRRVRIYQRAATNKGTSPLLAILRAHEASVTAVDWAPDAATSGLLATGAADGRVYLWRCFPS
jgi:WD domain, G-beta repeat